MTVATPNFKRIVRDSAGGLVLAPLVQAYLMAAKFPKKFDVTFTDAGAARKPDGWFHPSTHPLMTARQLYYYQAEPDRWLAESLAYENRMSVLMGTAVHALIQMCGIEAGWLIKPEGTCDACGREHGFKKGQCDEWGALDPVLRRRGHTDGRLQLDTVGKYWTPGRGLFEFKSGAERKLQGVQDNDLEFFKAKFPDYYAQVQEYMDIQGYRQAVVLFISLGYPWKPVEFQVPYDQAFVHQIRSKYELVLRHVEMGTPPPEACCSPRSKESRACSALPCPIKGF